MDERKLDITYSVSVDAAMTKAEGYFTELLRDFPPDIVEIALTKVLADARESKCEIYANALLNAQKKPEETVNEITEE